MTVHKDVSLYERESESEFWKALRKKCRHVDRRTLTKRIPSQRWLRSYKREFIPYDFIAGLTVALTAIPQGIAYAVLAGLPPQYGLYSEIMPGIMYMVFGSTSYITIGPTAIMALMIQPYVRIHPGFAFFGSFLTGAIILLLGVLNLGFIVDFISLPVTVGFTAAAAITIGSSQIRSLLGQPGSGNEFLESWINVFKYISEVQLYDTLLGIATIVSLLLLKRLGSVKNHHLLCRYIALSRNAIVVILGTFLAFLVSSSDGTVPFGITGQVASGLPNFQPPPFSVTSNGTEMGFVDMISEMGTSLFFIPVVAILEMVAVAKAFSHGKIIDASQELIALGMSSMMGSFVSGMPVTGSFTRTALNDASGVRTPFGGIYTSILVLSALGLLTGSFYYIPKPVLAGVILVAVVSMIEYTMVPYLWKTKKIDLLPLFATLIASLFLGLDLGILVGVALNLMFILQKTARPRIHHELKRINDIEIVIVTPDQSLCFSSSEYFRSYLTQLANTYSSALWIVIDGHHINHVDATVATGLTTLDKDFGCLKKMLIFWKWRQLPLGVLYRANPNFLNNFKHSETLHELIEELNSETRRMSIVA